MMLGCNIYDRDNHWYDDYESLNANLRIVLLTQVPKQISHPKIGMEYRENTIYLLCECILKSSLTEFQNQRGFWI